MVRDWLTPSNPCSRARGVALFRAQSDRSAQTRVIAVAQRIHFCTHPPAYCDAPASQPRRRAGCVGCSGPRTATLPIESCDSDVTDHDPVRSEPGPGGRPDRVTWMTRTRPDRGPCRPGPAGPTHQGVSDASERAGGAPDKEIKSHTKMYLANWPSSRESMRRRPRPGPKACPTAARVCAVSKTGAVTRRGGARART